MRRRVSVGVSRAIRDIAAPLLRRLTETPPPRDPLVPVRWTSLRQKRAVLAFLRKTGNLPYRRTGRMQQGWKVFYEPSRKSGEMGSVVIANYTRGERAHPAGMVYYWQFVVGRSADASYQQGFHRDTGWYTLQAEVQLARSDMVDAISKAIAVAAIRSL